MIELRALTVASAFVLIVSTLPASGEERMRPQPGSYELLARLELPHLERWAVNKMTTVCLPSSSWEDELPVPIVSANHPFAKCSVANVAIDGPKLEYDIVCPQRGSAKGHASYLFSAGTFSGRVGIVLGGKNMTMTEVQQGRRVGNCGTTAMAPRP